ncbi:MAG: glycosyltransferase family 2 protein [Thiothrix sp.]|nr:glycosyltransferase family 2 protein [Thiothrix sp.]HPQ96657.1 glycosyltransferase family 2 protein [Thiolinea sp.]
MTENIRVKLAAIAKDEAFYLPLWVYHHFTFGFDAIEIWVNDTTDNTMAVLKKLQGVYGERLVFSKADKELSRCLARGERFQAYAYEKIYEKTLGQGFSHLALLDLDEYWVSSDFQENVTAFIRNAPDFDVCLFSWLMDTPDHRRTLDDFPFQVSGRYQKNSWVKSMLNLKSPVRQIGIHKHAIKGGSGRYMLPNGDFVPSLPEHGGKEPSFLGKNRMVLDRAFICHQMLRSQSDYMARLVRGRKQVGGQEWLKTNRHGYVERDGGMFELDWVIAEPVLAYYRQGYEHLMQSLVPEMAEARRFVMARSNELVAALADDGFLQSVYREVLKGIDEKILPRLAPLFEMQADIHGMGFDEASACCWVEFAIRTPLETGSYELFLVQAFTRERLPASVRRLPRLEGEASTLSHFRTEVSIDELTHIYNHRQPPFALVAGVGDDWLLLEQQHFVGLGPAVFPKIKQLKAANKPSAGRFPAQGGNQADAAGSSQSHTPDPALPWWSRLKQQFLQWLK